MKEALEILTHTRRSLNAFARRRSGLLMTLGLLLFGAGLVFSVRSLRFDPMQVSLLPLLIVIGVTQPVSTWLNSQEFRLCGQSLGIDISWREGLLVSTSASLANILPLPAGLVMRGAALTRKGAPLSSVSAILFAAGLLWMSLAATLSFTLIARTVSSSLIMATGVALTGAMASFLILWFIARQSSWVIALRFLSVRVAMIGLLVVQLDLCFRALGFPSTWLDSAVYTVSGLAGVVVSVVPAGLGIIEGFGALLAQANQSSPAQAYLVLSIYRIISLSVAAIILFVVGRAYLGKENVTEDARPI